METVKIITMVRKKQNDHNLLKLAFMNISYQQVRAELQQWNNIEVSSIISSTDVEDTWFSPHRPDIWPLSVVFFNLHGDHFLEIYFDKTDEQIRELLTGQYPGADIEIVVHCRSFKFEPLSVLTAINAPICFN